MFPLFQGPVPVDPSVIEATTGPFQLLIAVMLVFVVALTVIVLAFGRQYTQAMSAQAISLQEDLDACTSSLIKQQERYQKILDNKEKQGIEARDKDTLRYTQLEEAYFEALRDLAQCQGERAVVTTKLEAFTAQLQQLIGIEERLTYYYETRDRQMDSYFESQQDQLKGLRVAIEGLQSAIERMSAK